MVKAVVRLRSSAMPSPLGCHEAQFYWDILIFAQITDCHSAFNSRTKRFYSVATFCKSMVCYDEEWRKPKVKFQKNCQKSLTHNSIRIIKIHRVSMHFDLLRQKVNFCIYAFAFDLPFVRVLTFARLKARINNTIFYAWQVRYKQSFRSWKSQGKVVKRQRGWKLEKVKIFSYIFCFQRRLFVSDTDVYRINKFLCIKFVFNNANCFKDLCK